MQLLCTDPTKNPSEYPTLLPSISPTLNPSSIPSANPTHLETTNTISDISDKENNASMFIGQEVNEIIYITVGLLVICCCLIGM